MTVPQIGERVTARSETDDSVDEMAGTDTDDSVDETAGTDAEGAGDGKDGADTADDPQGPALAFQVVACVVAALVFVSGMFAWWHTADEPEPNGVGDSRDAALIAARSHIETMNTLDHREVDEGVAAWASATTGLLHDQIVQITPEKKKLLAEQEKISVGKVIDAAVLDLTATTATVIAAVEVTIQDEAAPDSEPTVKRNRFTADLALVDGQWLLENVQQVAVNIS